MAFKLFEFSEKFLIGAFLIKLTQLEKTINNKLLICWEIPLSKLEVDHVFCDLYTSSVR